ncbi:hypothetical protein AB1Y20_008839 [Prymnesium parvum]|uniref:Uncharacterized protein n=1 Tax=Prymnesium parvum TaxID=97485 RepID=A0AB34IUH8_PRYPA
MASARRARRVEHRRGEAAVGAVAGEGEGALQRGARVGEAAGERVHLADAHERARDAEVARAVLPLELAESVSEEREALVEATWRGGGQAEVRLRVS